MWMRYCQRLAEFYVTVLVCAHQNRDMKKLILTSACSEIDNKRLLNDLNEIHRDLHQCVMCYFRISQDEAAF